MEKQNSVYHPTVCFVASDYLRQDGGGTGVGVYNHGLTHALLERGYRVLVVTPRWGPEDIPFDDQGVLVFPIYKGPLLRGNAHWYLSRTPLLGPTTALLLREMEWSFAVWQQVHLLSQSCHIDLLDGTETGNLWITKLRIPLVVRAHADFYMRLKYSGKPMWLGARLAWRLQVNAMRQADCIVAPSVFQAEETANELGWPPGSVRVIPNFIHPMLLKLADQSLVSTNSGEPTERLVLYTGRMEDIKGISELLDAMANVVSTLSDVRLVLAGYCTNSITEAKLSCWIKERGLSTVVQYVGHRTLEELAYWYSRATIFVMPSYFETFCISILEAMAFGKPVVATRVGGIPSLIEEEETGLLVPPHDSLALAGALIRLLENDSLRQVMGARAANIAKCRYTIESVTAQTLELYSQLLNGN